MQKIKYIIIFTLLLALGLLYLQVNNYDTITNKLLIENKSSNENTNILETKVKSLEQQIATLQEQIISLEEELSLSKIKIDNTIIEDTNYTTPQLDLNNEISLSNQPIEENTTSNITPNITLDDENKITGFEIEYKEEF